jgi:rhamnosyltransferase
MKDVSVIIVLYECEVDFYTRIIERLRGSVRDFVVISNSKEDEPSLKQKLACDIDVVYIENGDNLGIAKAQNIAASNANGKYLLFFDQDSCVESTFAKDLVESYEATASKVPGLGILSALDYDELSGMPNLKRIRASKPICGDNVRIVSNTLSSGSLILRSDFNRIGGNDEWLFIDQVDNDLCYRIIAEGMYVSIDTNVKLLHNLGEGKGTVFCMSYGISSPFRNYYQVRNMIYLLSKQYVPYTMKFKLVRGLIFKLFLSIFVLDEKTVRTRNIFKGALHGFKKVFKDG